MLVKTFSLHELYGRSMPPIQTNVEEIDKMIYPHINKIKRNIQSVYNDTYFYHVDMKCFDEEEMDRDYQVTLYFDEATLHYLYVFRGLKPSYFLFSFNKMLCSRPLEDEEDEPSIEDLFPNTTELPVFYDFILQVISEL